MAARFELFLDQVGKFHFRLCAADGEVLLTGAAEKSKIMAQSDVLHAREALRDPAKIVHRVNAQGQHYCELLDRRDATFARSSAAPTTTALEALMGRIGDLGANAPLVDRTRHRAEHAAG